MSDAPANVWFAMLRAMKHAARVMIANGIDDDQARATLLDRAEGALPDPGAEFEAHREPLRAMLARALDAEILGNRYLEVEV